MSEIYLVSCVQKKQPRPCPARDLYVSPWFQKARRYVEAAGAPWFILSAQHGLVRPETIVRPYELALGRLRVRDRREWASRVLEQLRGHIARGDSVVLLAGQPYREFLAPGLLEFGAKVRVPLAGLAIGRQLQWLDRHITSPADTRGRDLQRFYELLERLKSRVGGARKLAACDGGMGWPARGVYFFFEPSERRSDSGDGHRVSRVGTHALARGSKSKLWARLAQHRGSGNTGGGNHRGSVFRLLLGAALIRRDGLSYPEWGKKGSASKEIRQAEHALECAVSDYIRGLPFLWMSVHDEPSPQSMRGYIERNSIALLSNWGREGRDPPSENWLGHHSHKEKVRKSGLWNSNHVDESHDPAFLDELKRLIDA